MGPRQIDRRPRQIRIPGKVFVRARGDPCQHDDPPHGAQTIVVGRSVRQQVPKDGIALHRTALAVMPQRFGPVRPKPVVPKRPECLTKPPARPKDQGTLFLHPGHGLAELPEFGGWLQ
jgi:hypothetical protein